MKAIIKETGQEVEVVSRFMPKKRNAPGRAWVCVLNDERIVDEDALEYIEQQHADAATIKGWIARDGHGSLVFSNEKPSRLEWCGWKLWKISRGTPAVVLPNSLFPSLRWEDEPKPVRVIFEEIKEVGK